MLLAIVCLLPLVGPRLRADESLPLEPLPIYSTVPSWVPVPLPNMEQRRLMIFRIRRPAASSQSQFVTCTSTTANLTNATIQSAINAAADGAVVCLPAGTGTAGSLNFSPTKGITLAGQAAILGSGATTTLTGNGVMGMPGTMVSSSKRVRITGLTLSGGTGAPAHIWFYGSGSPVFENLRIDHNNFTGLGTDAIVMFHGDNGSCNQIYGIIDHNVITSTNTSQLADHFTSSSCVPTTGHRGTAQNLYYEYNTITITNQTNAGNGCIDNQGGASWVWRHNTTTNCLVTSHGVSHGWGPVNIEIAHNIFIVTSGADSNFQDCSRCFHHQGSGETLVHDNIFTAISGSGDVGQISMTHYRSTTPDAGHGNYSIAGRCDGTDPSDGNRPGLLGYPCKRQPGRDTAAALQPMYVWNNRRSDTGALIVMTVENPWDTTNPVVADHVAANRDYYNAVSKDAQTSATSPFNGTTGMGFGTLARRPTTCTTGAEAGGGVGYFATDNSTLYRCSATNTWTVQYIEFTDPAPWP